jgi:hypothetical protein
MLADGWSTFMQSLTYRRDGLTVQFYVLDATAYPSIGEATYLTGQFSYAWQPDIPGKYTIIACFEGSSAYASSSAQTAIQVDEVQTASPTPVAEKAQPMTDTYVLAVGAAIIIAIVVVGAVLMSMLKKR